MSKPLFAAEDFTRIWISPSAYKAAADAANALHDERCSAAKRVKEIQDSNREYSASLVQEIVSLKDEIERLRAELAVGKAIARTNAAEAANVTNSAAEKLAEKLMAENARLRESLEFYADAGQYAQDRLCEHAFRARAALEAKP